MKVLSANIGQPKEFHFGGRTILSSMHRQSREGGIAVRFEGVVGDKFDADKVHGVREAVVYALSSDFYKEFGQRLERDVWHGVFGENLTMDELDESQVLVGDEFEVGSCRLKVTAPRSPCNRLNFSFQHPKAQELFIEFSRPGIYFEVLTEGTIKPDDVLKHVKANGASYSVADVFDLWKLGHEVTMGRVAIDDVRPRFLKLADDSRVPQFVRSRFAKLATAPSPK